MLQSDVRASGIQSHGVNPLTLKLDFEVLCNDPRVTLVSVVALSKTSMSMPKVAASSARWTRS